MTSPDHCTECGWTLVHAHDSLVCPHRNCAAWGIPQEAEADTYTVTDGWLQSQSRHRTRVTTQAASHADTPPPSATPTTTDPNERHARHA